MKKNIYYTAKGIVLGKYWGSGNSGVYATITFHASTKKELLHKAEVSFNDGSIDSGMGYESLLGSILNIRKHTTIKVKEVKYSRIDDEQEIIGTKDNEIIGTLEDIFWQPQV